MSTVLYKQEGQVVTLTFNRPEVLNALSKDVLLELSEIIDRLYADDSVRVVILTGNGRAFVAGADISAMRDFTPAQGRQFGILGQQVMNRLEDCPKPVIAAVNGFALGGGLEVTLATDIRIASENAKFGFPEVKLGIFPGFGGPQRMLRNVNYSNAKYYIFTGEIFSAQTALELGFIQKVVPPDKLMEEALSVADKICANSPIGVRMAKRSINIGMNMGLAASIAFDEEAFATVFATDDRVSGMTAFLKKEPPVFENK